MIFVIYVYHHIIDSIVSEPHLVGNFGKILADMSSYHTLSPCFGQQPTCRRHCDWESILVTCWHISQHNICKASAKLARQDRCLRMLSWASHGIAHVADMAHDALPECRHVVSWHVIWGGGLADMAWCRQFQLRNLMDSNLFIIFRHKAVNFPMK